MSKKAARNAAPKSRRDQSASAAPQGFASDNSAAMTPEALNGLLEANSAGHVMGYGADRWTKALSARVQDIFETDCAVFPVFNGTAANALSLAALCQSYHAVICHPLAHIEVDESGAPEFFSGGAKLVRATLDDKAARRGLLSPAAIRQAATSRTDFHFSKARAVSIAQGSELGTIYSPDALHAISDVTRELGLRLHMDGARFANAVAALGATPADITWRAGIDALSFGMTKNGLPGGELVVLFDKELAADFQWRCKQAGQIASKMRFLTAPMLAMLEGDVWLRHARHANAMAARLANGLKKCGHARLLAPVDINAVFVELDPADQDQLRERGWQFHVPLEPLGCRFMCAWDTRPDTIDALLADIAGLKG